MKMRRWGLLFSRRELNYQLGGLANHQPFTNRLKGSGFDEFDDLGNIKSAQPPADKKAALVGTTGFAVGYARALACERHAGGLKLTASPLATRPWLPRQHARARAYPPRTR